MNLKDKLLSLLKTVGEYNPEADLDKIKEAYFFAEKVHQGQKRLSGKPFVNHALSVAQLVAGLNLDENSIVAAMLHDILDECKTNVKLEEVEEKFGLDVALLVDGVSNFRQAARKFPIHQESIDQFRKFLLASVEDVRVLIIRLSDKVHNARTLEYLPVESQERFAKRIFHLYSPLAEYAGLGAYKRELDDKAFEVLYPEEFEWLCGELKADRKKRKELVKDLKERIRKELGSKQIRYKKVFGRAKGLWSTYNKIQRYLNEGKITEKDPSAVLDQIGLTVLLPDIPSCYAALGVIHTKWEFLREELDDYIARPKPNGYRAIQTTIKWKNNLTAEIQIKTPEMHEYNEFGPASHIAYKVMGGKSISDYSYQWVKELVSWRDGGEHKRYKVKVFEDYVYCLTPKGDILQLRKGSTPVDFAYQIHTDLGHSCCGAKVNDRLVKLNYRLKNGDLVEIMSDDKRKKPNRDWLEFVKTKEAEKRIRSKLI
jgi:GTP diphosphokinase / guanosine-3',5'-bis(diphosphate) 3'-diphosphatase